MIRAGSTATEIVREVHAGTARPSDVAEAHLDQIERFDSVVKAFVTVEPDVVRTEAAWLDMQAERGVRLPLHGVPVGVKDIIDVAGLPTIAGFEPRRECVAEKDAEVVSTLRSLGAIMLGKTHTTQFASGGPALTRNPWNLSKSPAGSSAGSGAAVAAKMAPITLGTQTNGSVLRPAAFNGVIGFKPSYGWISMNGVLPACWSIDHLGYYGSSVDDIALVFDALRFGEVRELKPLKRLRIGLLTEFFDLSSTEVAEHVRWIAGELHRAGAIIIETSMPESLDYIISIRQVIGGGEISALHAASIKRHREHYDPGILASVEAGALVPASYYVHAQRLRRALTRVFDQFLSQFDAVMLPTVSTVACDRSETGDRRFQVPATIVGAPSISLPSGLSSDGLPIGTQLIARRSSDRRLLDAVAGMVKVVPLINLPDLEPLRAQMM